MAEKENAPQDKGKGGAKKWIIIGGVVAVLLIAAGVCGYLLLKPNPAAEAQAQAQAQAALPANTPGPMLTINTFIVNILDETGPRYLKAAMTLECESDIVAQQLEARRAQMQDAILLLIGNKTYDELRDMQGKLQLRSELQRRLNELLPAGGIRHIYFTDFVVQ